MDPVPASLITSPNASVILTNLLFLLTSSYSVLAAPFRPQEANDVKTSAMPVKVE